MSLFSSICLDHDDKFDVAFSIAGDEFRIAIDDDGDRALIMFLTGDETKHLIEVLQKAVKRADR